MTVRKPRRGDNYPILPLDQKVAPAKTTTEKTSEPTERELPKGAIGWGPDGKTPIFPQEEDPYSDLGYKRPK